MPKGQAVSGDFIVSIVVFLLVLAIIIPSYERVSQQVKAGDEKSDMEVLSLFASDALLKTSGYPNDWNSTNIQALGIANKDGKINITKIRNFMKLNYTAAKQLLGMSASEFNLSFFDIHNNDALTGAAKSPVAYFYVSNNKIWPLLNGSGAVWDIYYGGAETPEQGDAKNVYTGSADTVFDEMTANRSYYNTMIVEEPGLLQNQVNVSALQDFVARGGILIFEGNADLIQSGFSMHASSTADTSGFVSDTADFIDSGTGSAVSLSRATWNFYSATGDNELKIIVNGSSPGYALIGKWNYGLGEIYYVADVGGSVNNIPLASALYVVGRSAEFGTELKTSESLSIVDRIGIMDVKNQPVKIVMVVWKS